MNGMQEQVKHSPSPWTVEFVQRWPFGVKVVDAAGRELIAQAAYCHSTEQKNRADNEAGVGFDFKKKAGKTSATRDEAAAYIAEQDANASLWGAAPDLLAACETALDDLKASMVRNARRLRRATIISTLEAALSKAQPRKDKA